MLLKIRYFGILAEVTDCFEETISFSGGKVSDVLKRLFEKYPTLEQKTFKVAHDQCIVSDDIRVSASEIVLLPPFAGG